MAPYCRDELHDRSFFVAEPREEQPLNRQWPHEETHEGIGEPDVFELYWLPVVTPGLATRPEAGHGALLNALTP